MSRPKIPEHRRPRLVSAPASPSQPIGPLLDELHMTHRPSAGDHVEGAVVLLKVREDDGVIALRAVWSEGLSWLERIGMLREAEMVEARRNLGHAESEGGLG